MDYRLKQGLLLGVFLLILIVTVWLMFRRRSCKNSKNCSKAAPHCLEGKCVECRSASDCTSASCLDGKCLKCRDSSDCPVHDPPFVCHTGGCATLSKKTLDFHDWIAMYSPHYEEAFNKHHKMFGISQGDFDLHTLLPDKKNCHAHIDCKNACCERYFGIKGAKIDLSTGYCMDGEKKLGAGVCGGVLCDKDKGSPLMGRCVTQVNRYSFI